MLLLSTRHLPDFPQKSHGPYQVPEYLLSAMQHRSTAQPAVMATPQQTSSSTLLYLVRAVLAALPAARLAKMRAVDALSAPQRLSAEVAVVCSARPAAHHTQHVSKSSGLFIEFLCKDISALLYEASS